MMKCTTVMDRIVEADGDEHSSLLQYIRIQIHLFLCPQCAEEVNRYESARELLATEALPEVPDLSDMIMAEVFRDEPEEYLEEQRGFSFRSWIIAGCVILISLVSAFFGLDFQELSANASPSFMLAIGLTIGIIISVYGALFIGTHVKRLSERFRLH
ncbi:peptidoglycan-binding protein [Breznakiella homolactica]|uniref:Peptidoglycan-binding protein n=1 Tax=Breznakiella homolactica TaxID=2798577 RepID=A0A7T8BAE1_9SPIR|nr:peptidoglycan-binding protein [Breznakiella homolactica]QQO09422.1 peptidoglycan-binding protein [Breznakiella homolactica]